MKYAMIIALFLVNSACAQVSNDQEKLKEYIAKNQAQFEKEIQDQKQKTELTIERLKVTSKGLAVMGRIMAAFNGKKTEDDEATKLAQQAFDKINQIIESAQWQKSVSSTISEEQAKAQMGVVNHINEFYNEQIKKNPAKEVEIKAQTTIIFKILVKKMSGE